MSHELFVLDAPKMLTKRMSRESSDAKERMRAQGWTDARIGLEGCRGTHGGRRGRPHMEAGQAGVHAGRVHPYPWLQGEPRGFQGRGFENRSTPGFEHVKN